MEDLGRDKHFMPTYKIYPRARAIPEGALSPSPGPPQLPTAPPLGPVLPLPPQGPWLIP